MRIVRFIDSAGDEHYGAVPADLPPQEPFPAGSTVRVLSGDPFQGLAPTPDRATVERVLAPVAPTNIYCIGLNYRRHADESGLEPPETPVVFMKPTSAVCGPEDTILLPACRHDKEVDYEAELAVVIGRATRDVPADRALEHVAGYTCGNDVSARQWQFQHGGGQWVRGKGFDTFCPLGPVLVTPDEIDNPQDLRVQSRLNGRPMQDGSTADMIFSVAELIRFLSQDTTLLPGTVIMTGTPPGVGFARRPPVFLRPGDRIEVEVASIGTLSNPVGTA